MKTFSKLFVAGLVLLSFACGKDDNNCTQVDFIGTYIGTSDCGGALQDAQIVVVDGRAQDEVIINVEGSILTVTLDGCNFSGSETSADLDVRFSGSLDGNKIMVKLEGSVFSVPLDCTAEGTK